MCRLSVERVFCVHFVCGTGFQCAVCLWKGFSVCILSVEQVFSVPFVCGKGFLRALLSVERVFCVFLLPLECRPPQTPRQQVNSELSLLHCFIFYFYIVLFSTLKHTHCTLVACDSK